MISMSCWGSRRFLKPPGQMIVEKLFDDRMTCLVRKKSPEKQKRIAWRSTNMSRRSTC